MKVELFVNNPWQENTYLLYDETKEAVLIDCGCYRDNEIEKIYDFISKHDLKLVKLLNTHLHIDHVFGIKYIKEKYGFSTCANKLDEYLLAEAPRYSEALGLKKISQPPAVEENISDGDIIRFGNTELKAISTPGHSPGGMCYYNKKSEILFSGDTLFEGSIGRTDLPGGSIEQLLNGIRTKLLTLPGRVKVYTGHGPDTTIEYEKYNNPFL